MSLDTLSTTANWDIDSVKAISKKLNEPEAFLDIRLKALTQLGGTPFPNATQEEWRRIDPRQIGQRKFKPLMYNEVNSNGTCHPPFGLDNRKDATLFDLKENQIVKKCICQSTRDAGFVMGSMSTMFEHGYGTQLIEQLSSLGHDNDSAAITLSQIAFNQGGFNFVAPQGSLSIKPVWIRNNVDCNNGASFALNVIRIEKDAQAVLALEQNANATTNGWFGGFTVIEVEDGGRLDMLALNSSPETVKFYDNLHIRLGRNAIFNINWADLVEGWSVVRREVITQSKGAEAKLNGVHVGKGDSLYNLRTRQIHSAPHTLSDLLYKSVLFDSSKSVYQGLIVVEPSALNANAYQLNRNLLLDHNATADSIPMLEILVDEVRCTHGASSGKVNKADLFYLMSRGLNEMQATEMLVEGFLNSALDSSMGDMLSEIVRTRVMDVCAKGLASLSKTAA